MLPGNAVLWLASSMPAFQVVPINMPGGWPGKMLPCSASLQKNSIQAMYQHSYPYAW